MTPQETSATPKEEPEPRLSESYFPHSDYMDGFNDATNIHAAMAWALVEGYQSGIDKLEYKKNTVGLDEFEKDTLRRGYTCMLVAKDLHDQISGR